jgi:hypothetical protein
MDCVAPAVDALLFFSRSRVLVRIPQILSSLNGKRALHVLKKMGCGI